MFARLIVAIAISVVTAALVAIFAPNVFAFMLGFLKVIAGVLLGISIFALILPLIPGAIPLLANEPNRYKTEEGLAYEASNFGFFTFLEPGRVKLIVRGDSFIRCIMKFDGHSFWGEHNPIDPTKKEYWYVVETPDGERDSHPLRPLGKTRITLSPIYWYARYVYWLTGAVFTGIPPFQTVRVYEIERLVKTIDAKTKAISFKTKRDYSDHFRVADFQFFVEVPDADTQDKLPVRIKLALTAKTVNPVAAAYETDNAMNRIYTATSSKVTDFTRGEELDAVLSSKSAGTTNYLENAILTLGALPEEEPDSLLKIGIALSEVQVLDVTPTNDNVRTKLGDLAIARVDKTARITRAEGEAKEIELKTKAADSPTALEIARIEGDVRKVAAAPQGAVVIIGQNQNLDPVQVAILDNLKQNTGR